MEKETAKWSALLGIGVTALTTGLILNFNGFSPVDQRNEPVVSAATVTKSDSEIKYPVLYKSINPDTSTYTVERYTKSDFLARAKYVVGDTDDYYGAYTQDVPLMGGGKQTYELNYVLRGNGDVTRVSQSPDEHPKDVYSQLTGFTRMSPNGDVLSLTFDPKTEKVTTATAYVKTGTKPTVTSLSDDGLIGKNSTLTHNEYDVNIKPADDATKTTVTDQGIDQPITVGPYTITLDKLGSFKVVHKASDGSTDTMTSNLNTEVMQGYQDRTGTFFPDYSFDTTYTKPTNNSGTTGGSTSTPPAGGDSSSTPIDNSTPVVSNNGNNSSTAPSQSESTDVATTSDSGTVVPGTSVRKGQAVYAVKSIYLYSKPDFATKYRKVYYPKQKRINRPMFVVTGYTRSKNGAVRYIVRDVNHTKKTDGKKGYITANKDYGVPVYYSSLPASKTVTVIATHGINTYRKVNLTNKVKHYKKGAHLKVVKIVKHNLTTRYIMSNGQYFTTNKKFVIAGRY